MFVIKGKINTSRFFPMLHHEESPEKPQYGNHLFLDNPLISHYSPLPFLEKIFRRPQFPPILKKPNSPNFMRRRERVRTMLGLQLYHKRDSGTGVFLWILRKIKIRFFTEHLGRLLLLFFWFEKNVKSSSRFAKAKICGSPKY